MILLFGMGLSNKSVKKYLDKEKKEYTILDYSQEMDLSNIDLIIKSPSIIANNKVLIEAKKRNIKIVTDIEYFYTERKGNGKIIVVSGTNGKSTTVSLVKEIIQDIDLGGNIGYPLFDFIDSKKDIIIECSSYMGEFIHSFSCDIGCLLNIYPNHLAHHGTLNNYIDSKRKIFKNVKKKMIYNIDDSLSSYITCECNNLFSFGYKMNKSTDVYLENGTIYYYNNFISNEIININETNEYLQMYPENALAAISICLNMDIPIYKIRTGIKSYCTLEHRMEKICFNDITFYNDSKSTNLYALIKAMKNMNSDFTLICGGKIKNDDYSLIPYLENLKEVYVYGENKESFAKRFRELNKCVYIYDNLEEIVKTLNYNKAKTVLFSPGSESFDQFESFYERGKYFKSLLNQLFF